MAQVSRPLVCWVWVSTCCWQWGQRVWPGTSVRGGAITTWVTVEMQREQQLQLCYYITVQTHTQYSNTHINTQNIHTHGYSNTHTKHTHPWILNTHIKHTHPWILKHTHKTYTPMDTQTHTPTGSTFFERKGKSNY